MATHRKLNVVNKDEPLTAGFFIDMPVVDDEGNYTIDEDGAFEARRFLIGVNPSYPLENFATKGDLGSYVMKQDCPDFSTLAYRSELDNYARKDQVLNTDVFAKKDDLANYALKSDVPNADSFITQSTLDNYARKSEVPNAGDFVTRGEMSNYATKADVNVDNFVTKGDLGNYATKSELGSYVTWESFNNANSGSSSSSSSGSSSGSIDESVLANYATKESVSQLETRVNQITQDGEVAHKSDLPDVSRLVYRDEIDNVKNTLSQTQNDVNTVRGEVNDVRNRVQSLENSGTSSSSSSAKAFQHFATTGNFDGTDVNTEDWTQNHWIVSYNATGEAFNCLMCNDGNLELQIRNNEDVRSLRIDVKGAYLKTGGKKIKIAVDGKEATFLDCKYFPNGSCCKCGLYGEAGDDTLLQHTSSSNPHELTYNVTSVGNGMSFYINL